MFLKQLDASYADFCRAKKVATAQRQLWESCGAATKGSVAVGFDPALHTPMSAKRASQLFMQGAAFGSMGSQQTCGAAALRRASLGPRWRHSGLRADIRRFQSGILRGSVRRTAALRDLVAVGGGIPKVGFLEKRHLISVGFLEGRSIFRTLHIATTS